MKKEFTFERKDGRTTTTGDFTSAGFAFKGFPENCNGIITIEDIDNVKFFQHKYYRGELLEFCSLNSGLTKEECHEYFKSQFLCFRLADGEKIPSKYARRAKIYVREIEKDGEIIEQAYKYIPSMGDLSYKDAADFIQKVELLAVEMWQYSTSSGLREKAQI